MFLSLRILPELRGSRVGAAERIGDAAEHLLRGRGRVRDRNRGKGRVRGSGRGRGSGGARCAGRRRCSS